MRMKGGKYIRLKEEDRKEHVKKGKKKSGQGKPESLIAKAEYSKRRSASCEGVSNRERL